MPLIFIFNFPLLDNIPISASEGSLSLYSAEKVSVDQFKTTQLTHLILSFPPLQRDLP